jgi:S-layer homology domain
MFRSKYSFFASAVLLMAGIVASLPKGATAQNAPTFKDVPDNYWAKPFIDKLSQEEIIKGFPDGSFQPDKPVTRAQFAAIVSKAFNQDVVKGKRSFSDVAAKYWAIAAIDKAFTTGFMSGYTGGLFKPEQEIPKVQALVSLSSGLRLTPTGDTAKTLATFRDASEIPDYAKDKIAAATQKSLVVNYPKVDFLNPEESATRADIAAFVYQALVSSGEFQPLAKRSPATPYIVGYQAPATTGTTGSTGTTTSTTASTSTTTGTGTTTGTTSTGSKLIVSRGTALPVQLAGSTSAKLFIAPGETIQTEFVISSDIVDKQGTMLVPKGSKIQGRFQPVSIGGTTQATQFYAEKITIKDKTYPLNATSDPLVPVTEQSAKTNLSPDDLKGGLATVAAKAVLGSILGGGTGGGGINVGNILGGVLTGGSGSSAPVGGGSTQPAGIIIVEPEKLQIRMQSDMEIASLNLPTSIATQGIARPILSLW